ncbi:MAG: methyl-accepting chemotaxis protein, partial [Mucispirillum sp.]|nr:methyl-accepting chemotaxis protein [Mucispirillum sp.]
FMNLTIRQKINAFTITLAVIGLICGIYSLTSSIKGLEYANLIEDDYVPINKLTADMAANADAIFNDVMDYTNTGNEASQQDALQRTERPVLSKIKAMTDAPGGDKKFPKIIEMFSKVKPSVEGYISEVIAIMAEYAQLRKEALQFIELSNSVQEKGLRIYNDTMRDMERVIRSQDENLITRRVELMDTMNKISKSLDLMESESYDIINIGQADYDTIMSNMNSVLKNIDTLLGHTITAAVANNLRDMRTAALEMEKLGKSTEEIFHRFMTAKKAMIEHKKALDGHIKDMNTITYGRIEEMAATSSLNQTSTAAVSMFLIVLMSVASVLVMVILNASVVMPLRNFVRVTEGLNSGDGNLTQRIPVRGSGKDELAQLAKAFNGFIESIQAIIIEVKSSADEVASANNQLAATMEELSSTFASQAHQVSDM